VTVTCPVMAARLRAIARDERKVTANAARRGLRQAVKVAESRFAKESTLGRKLWGSAFWRGQKHTQRSLGIRRVRGVLQGSARTLKLYSATRDRARRDFERSGRGIPLIVGLMKSRWAGETWRGGAQARGVAGNIEKGEPFKAHRQGGGMHPGGRVARRPALEPAVEAQQSGIGAAIRRDLEAFMKVAIG